MAEGNHTDLEVASSHQDRDVQDVLDDDRDDWVALLGDSSSEPFVPFVLVAQGDQADQADSRLAVEIVDTVHNLELLAGRILALDHNLKRRKKKHNYATHTIY